MIEAEGSQSVQVTAELMRVLNLPRRTWTDADMAGFALALSAQLKRPGGTMTLRPIQAVALYECAAWGGFMGPMGVGVGKTLTSLLLPLVMGSRRPLLLTRANLIEKTKKEARELSVHWKIPTHLQIRSYDSLGRSGHASDLELFMPDFIIADEAHRLKNHKAAVTRRVARFMAAFPTTRMAAMSGTITRKSLLEWAHLAYWCLKGRAPIPGKDYRKQLEQWAAALDEKPGGNEVSPGALFYFCNEKEKADPDPVNGARHAMRRRLVETPGVVASTEGHLGSSLMISSVETAMSLDVDVAFQKLRAEWATPDGWTLNDAMQVNRHARELALGLYYVWDPRPPRDWIEARKTWSSWSRWILTNNRRNLDSELQVIGAVDAGLYPEATRALEDWRAIKGTFIPRTVPVWVDDSILNFAGIWAMKAPGIIWCEHVSFAERLASKTRLSYYGQKGLDKDGRPIESHPAKESLIASVASCGEGRNLQAWNRSLITSWPPSGQTVEQVLGRTHRPGQRADEVTYEGLVTSIEHVNAFDSSLCQARYIQASTGQPQKLIYADVDFLTPEDCQGRSGPRWNK